MNVLPGPPLASASPTSPLNTVQEAPNPFRFSPAPPLPIDADTETPESYPAFHQDLSVPPVNSAAGPTPDDTRAEVRTDVDRIGYPVDGLPGGTAQTTPVLSNLTAKYEWTIPNFMSIAEDKIVSLPFGTPEWRWQIILYPRGSPGSEQSHLSCFLRPLRNLDEIDSGDAWTRPILNFNIQILKGVGSSFADSFGDATNEDAAIREVLVEDTSASSFTAFDSSYPGWGFTYLLDLNYLNDAITPSGSLTVSAFVSAEVQTSWTTYLFPWCIPSFESTLLSGQEMVSPTFGPPENQWCIVLSRTETGISGHVQPVLSDEETYLGTSWG
ncbi:hypothetical protein BC829DRAFT_286991 [Chytridium lagenaria]|nr:hypothetical protein BC829DRAFT_286991 [Chytridium lagenaria]